MSSGTPRPPIQSALPRAPGLARGALADAHQLRGRIPGLDGLRAVAVLAVLTYHLQPGWLPGGYLGVDVFFVVSGFLITTLLLREVVRTGRIDLPAFWLRRARRLLPALAVVVVVAIVAARLLQPDLLVGIGRQALGAATFSSNWLEIAAGSSYFDDTAPVLFQTFWSLAIEEQFYLLWPPLLVALLACTRTGRSRAIVAGAGAGVSAALMAVLYAPGADPTRVYYGLDTHVFGLLIGVSLAFLWTTRRQVLTTARAHAIAPVVALIGLAVLLATLRDDSPVAYRGGILLASLLTAVVLAGCTGRATPLVRVLEVRPLVWVGARSYGMYLWHWPLILLVGLTSGAQPGTAAWWRSTVLVVALTLGLSVASYRWIETPIRRDGFRVTWHRVRDAVRVPGARIAQATAGVVVLAVVGACATIATAPTISSAEQAVLDGQAAIEKAQREAEQANDDDAPEPAPDDNAAPDEEPEPSDPESAPAEPKPTETEPTEPEPTDPAVAITGENISAFGDSVLSGAAPAMLETFPHIAIDAEPIRQWSEAPGLVRKALDADELRPLVVLSFGTNGGLKTEADQDALRTTLDLVGPDRTVVVVNVVGVSYWVDDTNATLASIVDDYPHAVVADWHAAVRDKPGLLHADRTHPNMEGITVYADVIEKAFESAAGDSE